MNRNTVRRFAGPLLRRRAELRYRIGAARARYPETPEELRRSRLGRDWWYYSMELLPGAVVEGQHPPDLPLLPRLMMRRCDVTGMACLDLGTMEGLIPVLLAKGAAGRVLAVDHSNHCVGKLAAVRHYHGVEFDYRTVGLMYGLHRQIPESFDLVNVSGLLYHVFSPLGVLASVRPLMKRNGLAIVSTNVTLERGTTMDFNVRGRLQRDPNTFWYPSTELFDYLLRYMRLVPIDCIHLTHDIPALRGKLDSDRPTAYVSVLCRASEDADDDDWMRESSRSAWEYLELSDWKRAARAPESSIAYVGERNGERIDVAETVAATPAVGPAAEDDSHLLRLAATS